MLRSGSQSTLVSIAVCDLLQNPGQILLSTRFAETADIAILSTARRSPRQRCVGLALIGDIGL